MPHATGANAAPSGVPVEMKSKLRNRFYEPIVLLLALNEAWKHNLAPKVLDQTSDVTAQTTEQLFRDFMNMLAQICDNKPKGTTVTAAVAIQYNDRVQYRFASNERSEKELEQLKNFVEDILNSLGAWTRATNDRVRASILRKIVSFNRLRLQAYVRAIYTQSQECLNSPENSVTTQTRETLNKLQELALEADNRGVDEMAFFASVTYLTAFVRRLSKSETWGIIRDKANMENGQALPWGKLRHAAGRLLSYFHVVKTLLEARKRWDRLFFEFEVLCLPSSTALSNPISRKDVTGEEIIGRMTSDQGKAATYRRIVHDLQFHFDVDREVRAKTQAKKLTTIVHAEILIHESIVNDPDLQNMHPSKFFDGYRYIGSSKPTCRLCHYYFTACADSIVTRQTHRNLYLRWRAPDVYNDQGDKAVKRREGIINRMLVWIREDTFRTLDDKVSERRPNDSHTDPTYNRGTSLGYTEGWNECIIEGMRQLSADDTESDDHVELSNVQGGSTEADEEDGDDGGVRLS
ncbi:hypothetical protein VSDG_00958 [Cytospora chrysosperma]|uniref:Uncharacterized protein n=1 Tax=Cytospora chrysosperma TaxID=252740 RepID=A0A423WL78_CYTCH|nr:hypothetical protein VSDG_00958 [Valsa sordida]